MAKRMHAKSEVRNCTYYRWLLYIRSNVFWADGRSNGTDLGRHSLGTLEHQKALIALNSLDFKMAEKHGLRSAQPLVKVTDSVIDLSAGIDLYQKHVSRSPVLGGASQKTVKRYSSILRKFEAHARKINVHGWHDINESVANSYAAWLEDEGCAPTTIALEMMTIKQTINFLISGGYLDEKHRLKIKIIKYEDTTTYCWTEQEVEAMVSHCRDGNGPRWLTPVIVVLAGTGLRISELINLRWSDICFKTQSINLKDERGNPKKRAKKAARTLKGKRSRTFPMHPQVFVALSNVERTPDGVVFHDGGGQPLDYFRVYSSLIDLVIKPLAERFPPQSEDGIGFADGRLHSFRHYFTSQCANANVAENAVMLWLGHRNSKMVKRYYHLDHAVALAQISRVSFFGVNG